ncbi:MAG: hypothetical protein LBR41_03270 [Rickettsiales bacterium]|nr:hypothetical protein [Rickettsiales bacterium]
MREMEMREMMAHKYWKFRMKRNIKFKGFVVNIVLMLIVWLCAKWGAFNGMHADPAAVAMYVGMFCGMWKLFNIVFFLTPAIAYWWEAECARKKAE